MFINCNAFSMYIPKFLLVRMKIAARFVYRTLVSLIFIHGQQSKM